MSITVVKKELTEQEKEDMMFLIEAQRDDAIKNKIEKSEEYRKKILEQKSISAQLENEIRSLTEKNTELKRQVAQETNILNQVNANVQEKRAELNAVTSQLNSKTKALDRDINEQIAFKENILQSIEELKNYYDRVTKQANEEFGVAVKELIRKQAEVKTFGHYSKANLIIKIQSILKEKGYNIDILAELNK